jgi:hypothetical protein
MLCFHCGIVSVNTRQNWNEFATINHTIRKRVADTSKGFPGYVNNLPIKLTDKPVEDRKASKAGWIGPVDSAK